MKIVGKRAVEEQEVMKSLEKIINKSTEKKNSKMFTKLSN